MTRFRHDADILEHMFLAKIVPFFNISDLSLASSMYSKYTISAMCYNPVNMPELGRFCADAASIGPEPAQFWHITAFLQGYVSLIIELWYASAMY